MLYDKDIREPLFDFLDEQYPVNRILEEKRMGRSRAELQISLQHLKRKSEEMLMKYENKVTEQIVLYIKDTYGVTPDFLWARDPKSAAFRHKEDHKWFGALLMETPVKRLGISGDASIDILDLKLEPDMITHLVDRKRYFPGYHMNKEHWITVLLDGAVPVEEIYELIDISFELTRKKGKEV